MESAERKITINDFSISEKNVNKPVNNFRGLIFSHNRALQLEASIRSYLLHCVDPDQIHLTVLFKATGEQHQNQYLALAEQYQERNIKFYPEYRLRADVLRELLPIGSNKTLLSSLFRLATLCPSLLRVLPLKIHLTNRGFLFFIVDDTLFVKDFHLTHIRRALDEHHDALGFSLRLGTNTTYCYTLDIPQSLPAFTEYPGNILKYQWIKAEADFQYPLEISSSIYRLEDIIQLLLKLSFQNPNMLEGRLAAQAQEFTKIRPSLLCFEQSVAFSNPVNKVQNQFNNRSGNKIEYTTERLAQMFDAGYRIDVDAYSGFVPNSCHQEVELQFVKIGSSFTK